MTISDAELTELYTRFRTRLLGYVVRRLKDYHKAADVVQECFITLCKQDYSKIVGHEEQWLFTVCKHNLIKRANKDSRYVQLSLAKDDDTEDDDEVIDENAPSPLEVLCDDEVNETKTETLQRAIQKLSPRVKKMLSLRYLQDMSYKAIAVEMGLTISNVGFLLYTAHDYLSAYLPASLKKTHNARKSKNRNSPRSKRLARAADNILAPK